MGRTTQMHIAAIQADVDDWAQKMAVSLALAQAQQDAEKRTARIAALTSTAGIAAANIHLSRHTPNRRLNRIELLQAAAQRDLDSLAEDIRAAIEDGVPMPTAEPVAEPVPVPVRLAGWAGIRQAAKAGRAHSKAYTDTYEREMARSRR